MATRSRGSAAHATGQRPAPRRYSGAIFVKRMGIEASPLGRQVADVVGAAFCGISRMPRGDIAGTEWERNDHVNVRCSRGLANFDPATLVALVVLATDANLLLEIRPRSGLALDLVFWRGGEIPTGNVPRFEELVARVRNGEKV
jgi:hypothetical protein